MNKHQRVQVERFDRAREFRQRFRAHVVEGSPIAAAFDRLTTVVTDIVDGEAAAVTRRRAGRDQKPSARQALERQLLAVVRTARVIGRRTPGFAEPFILPRARRDDVLRSAAVSFLAEAPPLAERFIARGLPPTFVEDLRAAHAAFEQALATQAAARVMRASGRAGLQEAIVLGRETLEEIDVIIRFQYPNDVQMQAAWAVARRVDRVPRTGERSDPAPAGPPPRPASEAVRAVAPGEPAEPDERMTPAA